MKASNKIAIVAAAVEALTASGIKFKGDQQATFEQVFGDSLGSVDISTMKHDPRAFIRHILAKGGSYGDAGKALGVDTRMVQTALGRRVELGDGPEQKYWNADLLKESEFNNFSYGEEDLDAIQAHADGNPKTKDKYKINKEFALKFLSEANKPEEVVA